MSEPIAVLVPQMNANDDRAVLVAWHVPSGGWIEAAAKVATLETSKTAFDVDAPSAGYVTYSAAAKTLIDVGAPFAWIHAEPPESATVGVAPAIAATDSSATTSKAAVADVAQTAARFSRKALRRMRELGLREHDFPGEARVDLSEVESRASAASQATIDADTMLLEQSPSKMLEAAMLADVYRSVVPSAVTVTCDAGRIDARLRQLAATQTVSLLELMIQEAALLLREFPELNGFFAAGQAYGYRAVHVGFAINAGRSLKVPVVRGADKLSQTEIAHRVREFTLRYMRDEMAATDLAGGTFTVTDLSMFGAVHFVPVLNARQSAILGVCAERPGIHQRDLVLAFDHRMSDGMRAAAFLTQLRARIEA
jgi:pyruvate/2-oxoglutarate dehydrogenase complex dihydrolipoamide acyltransferase (E2) component